MGANEVIETQRYVKERIMTEINEVVKLLDAIKMWVPVIVGVEAMTFVLLLAIAIDVLEILNEIKRAGRK